MAGLSRVPSGEINLLSLSRSITLTPSESKLEGTLEKGHPWGYGEVHLVNHTSYAEISGYIPV